LSFDATSADVSDLFVDCAVTNVRIVEDKLTKAPKGFGYVEFETVDGLKKALDLSGATLQGRAIRVSIAEPRKYSNVGLTGYLLTILQLRNVMSRNLTGLARALFPPPRVRAVCLTAPASDVTWTTSLMPVANVVVIDVATLNLTANSAILATGNARDLFLRPGQ
jgi:hypothetical protein